MIYVKCVYKEKTGNQRRAKGPLQLAHTDLAAAMQTPSIEGHKYVQSFTNDYSGTMFVYFLKIKSTCNPKALS